MSEEAMIHVPFAARTAAEPAPTMRLRVAVRGPMRPCHGGAGQRCRRACSHGTALPLPLKPCPTALQCYGRSLPPAPSLCVPAAAASARPHSCPPLASPRRFSSSSQLPVPPPQPLAGRSCQPRRHRNRESMSELPLLLRTPLRPSGFRPLPAWRPPPPPWLCRTPGSARHSWSRCRPGSV